MRSRLWLIGLVVMGLVTFHTVTSGAKVQPASENDELYKELELFEFC